MAQISSTSSAPLLSENLWPPETPPPSWLFMLSSHMAHIMSRPGCDEHGVYVSSTTSHEAVRLGGQDCAHRAGDASEHLWQGQVPGAHSKMLMVLTNERSLGARGKSSS